MLPPIDAHAHIDVRIATHELDRLGAAVLAVTRSIEEWGAAAGRRDATTVWGLGCHPSVQSAMNAFDEARFVDALRTAAFVGEVGLDRRSRVPMARQVEVLTAILRAVQRNPRSVSIHSTGATAAVLDLLERHRIAMPILHWWRGTPRETARAVELECLFSLNGHEAKSPKVIDSIPPERVLTETDFPHSRRYDAAADRPGATGTVEQLLASRHGLGQAELRDQMWRTLGRLLERAPPDAIGERLRGLLANTLRGGEHEPTGASAAGHVAAVGRQTSLDDLDLNRDRDRDSVGDDDQAAGDRGRTEPHGQ